VKEQVEKVKNEEKGTKWCVKVELKLLLPLAPTKPWQLQQQNLENSSHDIS
jgi:hypothetical protein